MVGSKYRELTVLESNSCRVWAKTLSTPAWSTKVTNPNPLQTSGRERRRMEGGGGVLMTQKLMLTCNDTLWAGRNHTGQINFQLRPEKPGSQFPHLERLVTGSRITIHSFTSPYLQKYSFKPSEGRNKMERRHKSWRINREKLEN